MNERWITIVPTTVMRENIVARTKEVDDVFGVFRNDGSIAYEVISTTKNWMTNMRTSSKM